MNRGGGGGGGAAPQWLARPGRGAVASLQAQFPDVDADVRQLLRSTLLVMLPCASLRGSR